MNTVLSKRIRFLNAKFGRLSQTHSTKQLHNVQVDRHFPRWTSVATLAIAIMFIDKGYGPSGKNANRFVEVMGAAASPETVIALGVYDVSLHLQRLFQPLSARHHRRYERGKDRSVRRSNTFRHAGRSCFAHHSVADGIRVCLVAATP